MSAIKVFEEEKKSLRRVTKIQKEIWVRPRRTIIRNRGDTNYLSLTRDYFCFVLSLLLNCGQLELKAKKQNNNRTLFGVFISSLGTAVDTWKSCRIYSLGGKKNVVAALMVAWWQQDEINV